MILFWIVVFVAIAGTGYFLIHTMRMKGRDT